MGRGSGRVKTGGSINLAHDGLMEDESPSLNSTLNQLLNTGYFEKDLLSYCANRLTEYSCTYWLDATVGPDDDYIDFNVRKGGLDGESKMSNTSIKLLQTNLTSTKYPVHFLNQTSIDSNHWTASSPTGSIKLIQPHQPITGTFLGSLNFLSVESKPADFSIVLDTNKFSLNSMTPFLTVTIFFIGFILNIVACLIIWKYSRSQLHLLIYLVYIMILDQIILFLAVLDFLVEAYYDIRLATAVQMLSRFTCQILPLFYNSIVHLRSFLMMALAIESCVLCHKMWTYLKRVQQQMTRNVVILFATFVLIFNSQFMWTFDLIEIDLLILHNRIVKHAFKCDLLPNVHSNHIYLLYVWPWIDHLCGDLLPCLVCLTTAIWMMYSKYLHWYIDMFNVEKHNKMSTEWKWVRYFNLDLIGQLVKAVEWICLVYGLCTLPKCAFYMIKYQFWSGTYPYLYNNINVQSHDKSNQVAKSLKRIQLIRPYEMYIELIEFGIRYLEFISILSKPIILIIKVKQFRAKLIQMLIYLKTNMCNFVTSIFRSSKFNSSCLTLGSNQITPKFLANHKMVDCTHAIGRLKNVANCTSCSSLVRKKSFLINLRLCIRKSQSSEPVQSTQSHDSSLEMSHEKCKVYYF